jgi:glycosyltransferase involved in cell wall biosynthesis
MSARSAAVLSVLPLGEVGRRAFVREFGADVRFLDLQRLRRYTLRQLWTVLREGRVAVAVVFSSPDEIQEFRDYLIPLACLLPAARREVRTDGEDRQLISAGGALLGSAWRMLSAWWSGFCAMLATWSEARARLAARPEGRRSPVQLGHCLYLKPGLNFGRPVGGSVAHVAGIANALVRRGCAVRLVASQPQAMLNSAVTQIVRRADFPLALLHELNQHQYRRRFAARALEEARKASSDFIYQRYALNDLSGASLRSSLGLPLVVEFNGSEVWVQRHWGKRLVFERAARAAERAALRAADLVVTVSEEVASQARSAGVDPRRILFVPNGVDAAEFDPERFGSGDRAAVRARLGIPVDALLYTFVGTFGEWHGTDVFADAIVALTNSPDGFLSTTRAHFLLVGDGPLGDSVRARLARPVAQGAVTFSGLIPHDESPAVLAAADILVAPHKPNADGSPFFGSPTKLFEYMAMARTIVASDLDQIGDVLRGWSPGAERPDSDAEAVALLVKPGCAESLENGMRVAARLGPAARQELGERARACVLRHFTWDQNLDAVLSRLIRFDGGVI